MPHVLGNYVEMADVYREHIQLIVDSSSMSAQKMWRSNGLTADFFSEYLSTFLPGDDAESLMRQSALKDAVSYIVNELLENAMRYSYVPALQHIVATMQLTRDAVFVYVANSVDERQSVAYRTFIDTLVAEKPAWNRVQSAKPMASAAEMSEQLGLLTMIEEYNAELAWKFAHSQENADVLLVTTMVRLAL